MERKKEVMKWYKFDPKKGSSQKRPALRRWVVVKLKPKEPEQVDLGNGLKPGLGLVCSYPSGIAVGYTKNFGGDPQSPYFVVPGIGGEVIEWCDCLPDDFNFGRLS